MGSKQDKEVSAQQALVDQNESGQADLATKTAAPRAAITKVRAKMRVERIDPVPNGEAYIHLRPVTSGSEENRAFYNGTPGGACTIGLVSKEVARMFVLNSDYFVDFTPAD